MKRGIIVTAVILSFLIIAIQSNAEVKIMPGGLTGGFTSPGDEAGLQLRKHASTGNYEDNRVGGVISAVNQYTGNYRSYGGYFHALSFYGRGVYGYATGTSGYGVYGEAPGIFGKGVYGRATNTADVENYGGYFKADGRKGKGVYGYATGRDGKGVSGYASYDGISPTTCGGYFEAKRGKGVHGKGYIYGVYGEASNSHGRGVYGTVSAEIAYAVYGENKYTGKDSVAYGGWFEASECPNGIGVAGYGKKWGFYSYSGYGPFTGAHEAKFAEDMQEGIIPGLIVSVTGKTAAKKDKNGEMSLSSTLPTVTISTKAKDKAVFGVIVSDGPLPENHWYEVEDGERFGVVNALGEGRVWVTDINGKIEAGDYITTSSVPGYGQMQDDDLLHSYTLGKAIETIDWEQATETVHYDGKTYKRYLIAVVYTSG